MLLTNYGTIRVETLIARASAQIKLQPGSTAPSNYVTVDTGKESGNDR